MPGRGGDSLPPVLEPTDADLARAATTLGCELAVIRVVAEVEAAGRGFPPDGRSQILYEAQILHRLTGSRRVAARVNTASRNACS